jgi:ATP-dependent DNA helicase RecQ
VTDPYLRLREAISADKISEISPRDFQDPVHRRLASAIAATHARQPIGQADLAGLIRHFLAREQARSPRADVSLNVPASGFWPMPEVLAQAGLATVKVRGGHAVRPERWSPAWLAGSAHVEPAFAATAEIPRRSYSEVSGDPFLAAVGRSNYRCVGQREAVRAVLAMPPASTLAINLPTGGGKSLCAQLPAVLDSSSGRLIVVVVPTTALAIDQERALSEWIGHSTAFYGDDRTSARRRGITARIHDGSQRVVFTSPEALLGGLKRAVYTAARQGGLDYLIIDEAHIVEQWGDGFRSAFQEIAGLRTDLLRVSPVDRGLRTVLMTATLTSQALATLETLFSKPEAFDVISAAQLRPEPEYWSVRSSSEAAREACVLEAVHRLPRSLILYVTKPQQAEAWRERLRVAGYLRCRSVTGKTPTAERERVIRAWQAHEIDIVVATSAFGVGMDQPDVRSVVHACVPENVDRFYQEVGRGGRDGSACVSLTIFTDQDLETAESMNRSTIIGISRGRERWNRMFADQRRVPLEGSRYSVPIDVVPSLRVEDIGMVNDRNEEWNARTLTLMSRAGLIEIDSAPSARLDPGDTRQNEAPQFPTRVVRILDEHHQDEYAWKTRVEPERTRARNRDERSFALMREVLSPARCLSEIFEEAYTIGSFGTDSSSKSVRVSRSCGGCQYCRSHGREPFAGAMPRPLPSRLASTAIGQSLSSVLQERSGAVFWEPGALDRVSRVLWWVASQGFRHVVIGDELMEALRAGLTPARARSMVPFLTPLSQYDLLTGGKVPTVVLVGVSRVPEQIVSSLATANSPQRLLLLPTNATSSSRPDRYLRDVITPPRFSLSEFEAILGL